MTERPKRREERRADGRRNPVVRFLSSRISKVAILLVFFVLLLKASALVQKLDLTSSDLQTTDDAPLTLAPRLTPLTAGRGMDVVKRDVRVVSEAVLRADAKERGGRPPPDEDVLQGRVVLQSDIPADAIYGVFEGPDAGTIAFYPGWSADDRWKGYAHITGVETHWWYNVRTNRLMMYVDGFEQLREFHVVNPDELREGQNTYRKQAGPKPASSEQK